MNSEDTDSAKLDFVNLGYKQLVEMPNEYLFLVIKESPSDSMKITALEILIQRWWDELLTYSIYRKKIPIEDAKDVVAQTMQQLYQKLTSDFEYTEYASAKSYIYKRLRWRINDYWRKHRRYMRQRPIGPLKLPDGTTIEIEEYLSDELVRDSMDSAHRAYIILIAEQCLRDEVINEKQFELVRRRMLGIKLPKEWSRSSIDVDWSRAKEKIILYASKDLED